ncbi:hypothetical protein [Nitrococcus mobilis]|nr:hypothetical protein [Nitrococcus mobilis]
MTQFLVAACHACSVDIVFLMLFVLAPLGVLRRVMFGSPQGDMARRLARMHYLHVALLILALASIAGGVAGSHGLN